jgi:hypothetical protein
MKKKRKRRKRCPYCGELFWPDGRTAWRQWACGKASCQARRRRETQRRYREKNAGDQEARHYRAAIAEAKSGSSTEISIPGEASIFRSLVWDEIKDEIEPQLSVTLVFYAKLLIAAMRDERSVQPSVINKEIGNYRFGDRKDETDGSCRSG